MPIFKKYLTSKRLWTRDELTSYLKNYWSFWGQFFFNYSHIIYHKNQKDLNLLYFSFTLVFFCQKISLTFALKFSSSFELKWWLITSYMKKCIIIIKYDGNSVINANKFAHRVLFYDVTSSDHMWPLVTKYALINRSGLYGDDSQKSTGA